MGHLIADDASGNRFSTSVHIVKTSFITKSISCTSQARNWSCTHFKRQSTQFCSSFLAVEIMKTELMESKGLVLLDNKLKLC